MLRRWLDNSVLPAFAGRVLSVDTEVAISCASLHVPDPRAERDALIGATAVVHGLTVATRNNGDFKAMNVALYDPWAA
jgi:predicted nucleic acid-binding protein